MASLVQLSVADWAILLGYLIAVVIIGIVASGRVKTTAHYFLGERKFGKVVMIAQSFGTGTHAEMPVSLAGAVYSTGLSGIWFQWKNLFVTPFYWLLAPLFRRFRRTSMSEVVSDRYGSAMGVFYTAFALIFFTINLGGMLKGAGKVINQSTGGHLSVDAIVIGMTVVFVLYSFIGGLVATAWTDVLQGLLILVLSFMVVPTGWHLAGGLTGMKATLGAPKFLLVTPSGIGAGFIAVLTLNGLVGIIAQPHLIAAVGTGKDELTCRTGQLFGNLIKRVCTVGWAVIGLLVATLVAQGAFGATKLADPEDAFGFACRHLLFPGGVGLLVACFLAANMAGCSAFMVDSGALVTNGLYRRIAPGRDDRHYLWVGRVSGLLVTISAVVYAVCLIDRVLYSFLLTETLATYVGISLLGGVIWRRANRWGAAASIAAALAVNFAGYIFAHQRLDSWDPVIFSEALAAGVVALVVVSLLTPADTTAEQSGFFLNLETPGEAPASEAAGEEAARTGQQLLLVNLLRLRRAAHGQGIFRAYRTDWLGLIMGVTLVLVLIAAVGWFFL